MRKMTERKKRKMTERKKSKPRNKGSRGGPLHHRFRTPKNKKTPWIMNYPKTKNFVKNLFGYKNKGLSKGYLDKSNSDHLFKDVNEQEPIPIPIRNPSHHSSNNSLNTSDSFKTVKGYISSDIPEPVRSGPSAVPSPMDLPRTRPIPKATVKFPEIYGKTFICKTSILTAGLYVSISLKPNPDQTESPGLMDIYIIADITGWVNIPARMKLNSVKSDLIETFDNFIKQHSKLSYKIEDKGYVKICLKDLSVHHIKDKEGFQIITDATLFNLFNDINTKIGEDSASFNIRINSKKNTWNQNLPNNKTKSVRCDRDNCIQVFVDLGTLNETLILKQSNKHNPNGLCNNMEESPTNLFKGSKTVKKKKGKNMKESKTKNKKGKKKKSS